MHVTTPRVQQVPVYGTCMTQGQKILLYVHDKFVYHSCSIKVYLLLCTRRHAYNLQSTIFSTIAQPHWPNDFFHDGKEKHLLEPLVRPYKW